MCVCQINYLNEGSVCVCVSIASGKRQMSHTCNCSASSDSSTLRGSLDLRGCKRIQTHNGNRFVCMCVFVIERQRERESVCTD